VALKDYEKQLDDGLDPTFDADAVGIKNAELWTKS
jgi:AGCS family alanine or glycine:cation symporter